MSYKYSRQREIIRSFMQGRTDHPTADTVYVNVRKEIPNISLGTVYRNLMLLTEVGELRRVDVGDGTVHFDPTTKDHSHFVCSECGEVTDIEIEGEDFLNAQAEARSGLHITGHDLVFRGLCAECCKKQATATA